ncbi:hypothetical protein OY671_012863, partial [Metschnikowia pulcherrima]
MPGISRGDGPQIFGTQGGEAAATDASVSFLYIDFSVSERDIRGYSAMSMDSPSSENLRLSVDEFIARALGDSDAAPDSSGGDALGTAIAAARNRAGPFLAASEHSRQPMLISDPHSPDNPVVFANQAFSTLTG